MTRVSIESFLSSQTVGAVESSGEFTVDPEQALAKMGRFQLSEPGLWVVKLAQAGVALGASRIEFGLDYRQTTVRFHQTSPVDSSEVARSLLSGELPREPWKRHLVVGLRAFHGQGPSSLSWIDGAGRRVTIEGPEVEFSEAALEGTVTLRIEATLPAVPQRFERWKALFQQTMVEHAALSQRCALCPIPIAVDGRLVSQQFPPTPPGGGRGLYPPFVLTLDNCGAKMPVVVREPTIPLSSLSRFPEPADQPQGMSGLALFFVPMVMMAEVGAPRGPVSYCFLVKDGVLLNARPIRFPFISKTTALRYVLYLYLDGSSCQVDLSEFEAVESVLPLEAIKQSLREAAEGIDFSADATKSVQFLHQQTQDQVAAEHKRALIEAIEGLQL